MRKNRLTAAMLTLAMTFSTFTYTASAGELENDNAVAGMALVMNNYCAGSEDPDREILEYLLPLAEETEADTESKSGNVVETVMQATVAAEEAAGSNLGLVSTLGYLNVRESASTSAKIIGRLYSNCQVVINSSENNDEGNWYNVTCGNVTGYVSSDYIITGDAAKRAEADIKNRYAVVTAESLDVYDSASSDAKVVGTVYMDEQYPVMEEQGDFAKLLISSNEVGFVSKSGVSIKTQFPEALKIDDQYTKDMLDGYLNDVNYSRKVYDECMANGDYIGAASAISYVAELLGYYMIDAENAGVSEELIAQAKEEQGSAQKLADAANQMVIDSGYYQNAAASQPQSSADTASNAEASADASASGDVVVEVPTLPSIQSIEACYQGGTKYAGDVIYSAELFVRVTYGDGSVKDITDGWSSPNVGMFLHEGSNVVTMYYGNFSSSFELNVLPVPTQPETAPAAPAETAPAQPETAPAAPVETAPAQPETAPAAPVETAPAAPAETAPAATAPAATAPAATAPAETTPAPATPTGDAARNQVVNYALSWVGRCNYVYGGSNLSVGGAVDCSGFTMNVYATVGIHLSHYSGSQLSAGYAVSHDQLVPGDLVCFNGHVGIYIGNDQMVHAASPTSGIIVSNIYYNPNKQPIGFRRLIG